MTDGHYDRKLTIPHQMYTGELHRRVFLTQYHDQPAELSVCMHDYSAMEPLIVDPSSKKRAI